MAVFGDKTGRDNVPKLVQSELSDFIKTERTWAFAVDVNKAVFLREGGSHQHLSSVAEYIRICRESRNRPPDKLGGLGVGQVKELCCFHNLFCPDETWVERNHGYAVQIADKVT
jgi:hypothetical protein